MIFVRKRLNKFLKKVSDKIKRKIPKSGDSEQNSFNLEHIQCVSIIFSKREVSDKVKGKMPKSTGSSETKFL